MKVRKLGVLAVTAVVLSFLASGPAGANEQDWGGREPKAEASAKKKKKVKAKAKAKAKATAKKAKAKTKAKAKPKVAKARRSSAPKSHYPTQPNAGSGAGAAADHPAGLPELSNEQKDDLPPPQNTEPSE